MKLNSLGYLEARDGRNVHMIKDHNKGGSLFLGSLYVPKHLVGKRLRLKVEFVE